MAAAMRERMESLVDHVLGRAEAAGYPDEQREAAAAEATALFAQAAERLENAVFNPGEGAPLDRAQLARFFQSSFSALQGQIFALLGDGPGGAGSPATTYGPGAGAEAMSAPRGRVDFEGLMDEEAGLALAWPTAPGGLGPFSAFMGSIADRWPSASARRGRPRAHAPGRPRCCRGEF